ncbi:MAG: class I SAM-dependent methyltransferase [Acidobacteria bacterium]|nr:class I SAM-dependent methyltransferase [Acidobacteriota bacterium]
MELNCRFCNAQLEHVFADLGSSPLANSYLEPERMLAMEPRFPLTVYVCGECFLVQLPEFETAEAIFSDYAYFSSYSDSWVAHAKRYSAAMIERFGFDDASLVIEIASNDGYLLQHFKAAGVPVLGIEPAANIAVEAEKKGIPSRVEFFGADFARQLQAEGKQADLLLGNNVFAHVPPLNDFVEGLRIALAPQGVITLEFPHLMRLMAENQFDTIYHEHYSYYSLSVVERLFAKHGLTVFDVEELPTHGGSLRLYGRHAEDADKPVGDRVPELLAREEEAGFGRLETYLTFDQQIRETKRKFWEFVIPAKRAGKQIVGYGAPAKGNTFLNYCGAGTDVLDYTVDRSPAKHGRYLPGSRIPIHTPEKIFETRPDYVLILPWNLEAEITEQMAGIREWGGKFVVAIPETRVLD